MPADSIMLTTPDGPMRVYEATPDGDTESAIVVIQEAFGVNPHIEDVTRRFAAAGYHAVLPADEPQQEPVTTRSSPMSTPRSITCGPRALPTTASASSDSAPADGSRSSPRCAVRSGRRSGSMVAAS